MTGYKESMMQRDHGRLWAVAISAVLLAVAVSVYGRQQESGMRAASASGWEPMGLSGGGAMFTPAISPADPNRMMVNCDMSAAYVSADGGRNWRMIHYSQLRTNTRCRPAFHPTDPRVVYAADGGGGRLKISRDGGETWQLVSQIPSSPHGEIAIDPGRPDRMLVGTSGNGGGVFRSVDAGKTWVRCDGPRGEPLSFHFDQTSPADRRVCFAATREGIWRSDDGGSSWSLKIKGLPMQGTGAAEQTERGILAFAGGSNAGQKVAVLYCSVPGREENGRYAGGIYRSTDRGETWQWAMGEGLNKDTKTFDEWAAGPVPHYRRLLTTDANPRIVYAFNSSTGVPPPHDATVYRSEDTGKTWRATFQADPRYPGLNVERDFTVYTDRQYYNGVPLGVAISASDPDRIIRVDTEHCYITDNGGKSWRAGHTILVPGSGGQKDGARWLCNGLVVTSTWDYYVDPFQANRHYIAYTDVGFAYSDDAGKSWRWWAREGRPPWRNTTYELAFDPETPGKVWGAFSNSHDIPNGNIISGRHRGDLPGGVCVSDDHAKTWKVSNHGMPAAPVVSVVVDPRSAKGARTLYAGIFGHGIYKSTDDGKTWTAKNTGLGAESNRRVCRVILHRDGTLFALVTAKRQGREFLSEGVGLYRSADGGERWSKVNESQPLLWPKDVTVDPKDSRILYIGAADANGQEQGGLYRTKDGGATWQKLARKGPEHFGAYLHPRRPGWIYATLTEGAPDAGLWLSRDDGATWEAMRGLPFSNAQRVAFVPSDPDRIYVTTFGGSIWRGPAAEEP